MPYIGRDLNRGNYLKLDDISSSFNSQTKTFNLTVGGSAFTPGSAFSILVSVGGVIQEPESAYQVNNSEITFANAPTAQDSFFCIALGVPIAIGVPGNSTVNGTQMAKPFNYDGFFYLNDTSNRVGINSSIPTASLDVIGDIKLNGSLVNSGGSGGINAGVVTCTGLDLNGNGDVSGNFVIGGDLTVNGTTSTIDTNLIGVDRIEVGANSSTIAGIAVTQSGTADILNLYDGSNKEFSVTDGGTVYVSQSMAFQQSDRATTAGLLGRGSLLIAGTQQTDFAIRSAPHNSNLVLGVGVTERLRIDSDGDVIIGSGGSWQYKKALNVQGSSGSILSLYNADTTTYAADTNSSIELKLLTGNTGNQFGTLEIRGIKENGTNGNNARALSFYTGANGGSNLERLRINSVGIITSYATHPQIILKDPSNRQVSLRAPSTSNLAALGTDSSHDLVFYTNGYSNERLRITSGGKVGINETSPDGQLHIKDTNPKIILEGTNGSGRQHEIWSSGGNSQALQFTSGELYYNADIHVFRATNETTHYGRFDTGGRLLIGGTSNSASSHADELQIINTSAQGGLSIINASNGQGNIYFGHSGGTADGRIEYSHQADYMRFFTANDERLRIDSSGRVGIGTNTMDSSAEVSITNASSSARVYMKSADNADCSIYFGSMNDSATGAIRYDHSDDTLRFYGYNNSQRLTIQSTGIVKVESNDSSGLSAHLVVNNSESNSGLSIMGSGSSFSSGGWAAVTDAGIIRSSANSSNGLVLQAASGDMRFYVGGNPPAERVRITSDGQLSVNVVSHHTSSSGILNATATTAGKFGYKAIEIGAAIASGTDQGALIVGRRKAASSIPTALLGCWDDGTGVTLYHGGGWSTWSSSCTTHHFYTDGYATGDNSGSVRLSIGSNGQIYLNNRDSNNSSHRGQIIAYAPPTGEFAYKSLEIGSTNPTGNANGGLIVAQRMGTTAYPFALMGSWDNGSVCNIYYGGGWGSQSAPATHHKFYAGSYASSGGAGGSEVFKIDSSSVTVNNDLYVSDNIVHIGDTTCKIRFPSNDNIQFETAGSPRLNITTGGCVYSSNFGIGTDDRWKIRPNNSNADLAFEYSTSSNLADSNIKMVLKSTGRLGLNRQAPDYLLDVDGESVFRNFIRFGSGGVIKSTAYSGASYPTYDTGVSVNAYGYGGGMVILCHQNYNAGTGTRAGVYHLWFYYDGNHQPPVTHMGGSNFVTFGKSSSNTLTISMGAGNNMFSYFGSGLNI